MIPPTISSFGKLTAPEFVTAAAAAALAELAAAVDADGVEVPEHLSVSTEPLFHLVRRSTPWYQSDFSSYS